MDNLTQEQVKQQISAMSKQVAYHAEQLALARGAHQMLEHLLTLFNPEESDRAAEDESESEGDDGT